MLAGFFQAAASASTSSSVHGAIVSTSCSVGRANVSVPVLSTTSVSISRRCSMACASRNNTPELRAAAARHHDGDGRGEAERTGAGDDEHGHRVHQRIGQARLGPDQPPDRECDHRDEDDRGNEPRRNVVCQALQRRAAALRLRDQRDDLRQQAVRAHTLRDHHDRTRLVEGGADDAIARTLVDGQRFAGEHGFIESGAAFDDAAVDRHLFAGTDAHAVADHELIECHVFFRAIGADTPRGLGREPEQLPDREAGAAARRELQPFAQQHQRDDDRGRFEVHADHAVRIAHFRRKGSRRECREQAERVGHQHAKPDQRVHVGRAVERPRASRGGSSRAPAHSTTGSVSSSSRSAASAPCQRTDAGPADAAASPTRPRAR